MANMFEKYAADREAEQERAARMERRRKSSFLWLLFSGNILVRESFSHHALAVAYGERQEGAEDDGGGARDDDCRDYPRVGRGTQRRQVREVAAYGSYIRIRCREPVHRQA